MTSTTDAECLVILRDMLANDLPTTGGEWTTTRRVAVERSIEALGEVERLGVKLDGQERSIAKHRATWRLILRDRRGWREAAKVERARHIVWEQRFEEERRRAAQLEIDLTEARLIADKLGDGFQKGFFEGAVMLWKARSWRP